MSLVTSVIGGIMGGHAAGTAANAQVGGLQQAGATVTNAANAGNTQIQGATADAQGNILNSGTTAGTNVTGTAATGATGVNAAAGGANTLLNPYATAGAQASGELASGLAPGGNLNSAPTLAQLQMDPGYAFQLQQGDLAIQRSAAASGGEVSGSTLAALNNYSQGVASQEYQNAFNNYQTSTQNAYNNLMGVSNAGQAAAGTQGANLTGAATFGANTANTAAQYTGNVGINTNEVAGQMGVSSAETQANNSNAAANYTGNTQIQAGNARAGGIVNKQNAYNSMLSGIGSSLNNAALGFATGGIGGAVSGAFGSPFSSGGSLVPNTGGGGTVNYTGDNDFED